MTKTPSEHSKFLHRQLKVVVYSLCYQYLCGHIPFSVSSVSVESKNDTTEGGRVSKTEKPTIKGQNDKFLFVSWKITTRFYVGFVLDVSCELLTSSNENITHHAS